MELEAVNRALFAVFNAPADVAAPMLLLGKVAARYLIDVSFAVVVLKWFVGDEQDRRAVTLVLLSVLLSLALNYFVAHLFPRPRPFMIGVGHTFMSHRAENGFPSDHATPMWTIAFGMLMWSRRSLTGWIALALAAATSWARVYLGVHFPFDILGSMAVAVVSVIALAALRPFVERTVARPVEAWRGRMERGGVGRYLARGRGWCRSAAPAVAAGSTPAASKKNSES